MENILFYPGNQGKPRWGYSVDAWRNRGPRRGEKVSAIVDLERRAVLGPGLAVVVDADGGDIGVAEPLLDLGDVGLVIERIGGGRRAQRMSADLVAERHR